MNIEGKRLFQFGRWILIWIRSNTMNYFGIWISGHCLNSFFSIFNYSYNTYRIFALICQRMQPREPFRLIFVYLYLSTPVTNSDVAVQNVRFKSYYTHLKFTFAQPYSLFCIFCLVYFYNTSIKINRLDLHYNKSFIYTALLNDIHWYHTHALNHFIFSILCFIIWYACLYYTTVPNWKLLNINLFLFFWQCKNEGVKYVVAFELFSLVSKKHKPFDSQIWIDSSSCGYDVYIWSKLWLCPFRQIIE